MKGVQRLKVPACPRTPKLFVITLSWNGVQKKFTKAAWGLEEAVGNCYFDGHTYTLRDYINHVELSVDEINSLFKEFRP